ncbi:MAG: helix-turn-helix domain-containing protein [Terriglobales bacterium]
MDTKHSQPLLLTVNETAHTLSLNRRSIERLLAAGQLPSRKFGRRRLIPYSAVQQFARRDCPRIGAEATQ